MQEYVLGFAFNNSGNKLVLIKKEKPDWQKGLLNGVGGKVEKKEAVNQAMIREFQEETGVYIQSWDYCGVLKGLDFLVHVFMCYDDATYDCQTCELEEVVVINSHELENYDLIPNLYWLINLVQDIEEIYPFEINYRG